jgi:uncharacterized protein (TIGR02453 family)
MAFEGFPADTVKFLAELAANNNREWFQANKDRYERSVRAPAIAFIEAMARPLERVSRHIYVDPSPVGGSLMRIYRDTRFSPDKAPYKTNIGIQFRHERGEDAHAPALYLHIEPKEFFLACGMWRPPAEALAAIRARIVEHPDIWTAVRDERKFNRVWGPVTGESLTRLPRGYDPNGPCVEDLKRKEFLGVLDLPRGLITSPRLPAEAAKAFAAARSLMKFLCDALALPY